MVWAAGPRVEKQLPQIFERIDAELPILVANHAAPGMVNGLIAGAIADATGRKANRSDVAAVIGLYNPVVAATRNLQ